MLFMKVSNYFSLAVLRSEKYTAEAAAVLATEYLYNRLQSFYRSGSFEKVECMRSI